ncbi:MAG: aminotransferase class V-fold PLP-dependent enzyme [Myxococcota bacterium]
MSAPTHDDDDDPQGPRLTTDAALSPEAFRRRGHALIDVLADYLSRALDGALPVIEWRDPAVLATLWPADIGSTPNHDDGWLLRVLADAVHQHHPRCVGHQVAVPWPDAALNEVVLGLLNNGMAAYESGPISSALERNVVRWFCARAGMGPDADGVLTSGGTLGTLTSLLAARHAAGEYDPEHGGGHLSAVLTSVHGHYAVRRAATVMGWGRAGVIGVPVDACGRMDPEAAARAVANARTRDRRVVAIVATASNSVTGAYDPIAELADLAAREGLWLHVDGAHGASALMSRKYRHRLEGVERADSLVWDAHKLLGLPALATAVLFRRGATSFAPFAEDADYLYRDDAPPERWYDYGVRNLECTKRMMSVAVYAALRRLGTDTLDRVITSRFDLAADFATALAAHPDFELAVAPEGNIVTFRYAPAGVVVPHAEQDRRREAVNRSGAFYFTRATIDGVPWMRVTLMHPQTTATDLEALLAAVAAA